MSDDKGPKVDLPPDLEEEIESSYADSMTSEIPFGDAGPAVERIAELERETGELNDKYLRLAADYDNYKRRTLRERQETLRYGNENLVKELLGSVDNLERAVEHGRKEEVSEEVRQILEGVELTYRAFLQTLEKFGVQEVAALGEAFDPNVHEAVRQVPSDEHPSGTVTAVFQKGYLLVDRLLRPAMVAVSSGPTEKSEEE